MIKLILEEIGAIEDTYIETDIESRITIKDSFLFNSFTVARLSDQHENNKDL